MSDWSSDVCSSDLAVRFSESLLIESSNLGKSAHARPGRSPARGPMDALFDDVSHDSEAVPDRAVVAQIRAAGLPSHVTGLDVQIDCDRLFQRHQRHTVDQRSMEAIDRAIVEMIGQFLLDRKSTRLNSSH